MSSLLLSTLSQLSESTPIISSQLTPTESSWVNNYDRTDNYITIPDKNRDIVQLINPNMETGPWIAGGAPLRWSQGLLCRSDVDVFFRSKEQYDRTKAKIDKLMDGVGLSGGVSIRFQSENAITYSFIDCTGQSSPFKLQLIYKNFYNTVYDIFENFDITVCKVAVGIEKGVLNFKYGETAYMDIKNKILRLSDRDINENVIRRIIKYIGYGYIPEKGLMDRIIKENSLYTWDFTNQIGVDEYDGF